MSATTDTRALQWAVKESFRAYVHGVGGQELLDGVATDGAELLFPFDADASSVDRTAFAGGVTFVAHGGMLAVRIRSPRIEHRADGDVLTILHPEVEDTETDTRLVLADLEFVPDEPGPATWAATLATTGVWTFDGQYAPGTPLAPVHVAETVSVRR